MMNESKRVRIISICGDTRGFGSWGRRTGEDQKHFESFMGPFIQIIEKAKEQNKCWAKHTGDGFLASFEIRDENFHNCDMALKALRMAICIKKKVRKVIDRMRHPKPAGFRIRLHCGPGWKYKMPDGKDDYFSPIINDNDKLLKVNKFVPIICHDSVKELLSPKQIKAAGLNMTKVKNVDNQPDGLDKEDLNLLWQVSFGK